MKKLLILFCGLCVATPGFAGDYRPVFYNGANLSTGSTPVAISPGLTNIANSANTGTNAAGVGQVMFTDGTSNYWGDMTLEKVLTFSGDAKSNALDNLSGIDIYSGDYLNWGDHSVRVMGDTVAGAFYIQFGGGKTFKFTTTGLDMNTTSLTNLVDPTTPQGAATLNFVTNYVATNSSAGGGGNFTNPSVNNIIVSNNAPEFRGVNTNGMAYYRLARNSTANTMTLYNNVFRPAVDVYAISLDGANDYGVVADSPLFTPGNGFGVDGPFSISVWVKPDAGETEYWIVDKDGGSGIPREWSTYVYGGNLVWFFADGLTLTWMAAYATTNALAANVWTHLVFTYSGSETTNGLNIYTNGGKCGLTYGTSGTYAGNWNQTTPVRLGVRNDGFSPFDGSIDEVLMFRRELSQTEVTTLWNSGSGIYGDITQSPCNSNCVLLLHLDEGTGTNYVDSSGSNNVATGVHSPTWIVGKVLANGTTEEVAVATSENGTLANEYGIQSFGNSLGGTVLKGTSIRIPARSGDPAVYSSGAQIYSKAFGTTNSMYIEDSIGNVTRIGMHEGITAITDSYNRYTGYGRRINLDALGEALDQIGAGSNILMAVRSSTNRWGRIYQSYTVQPRDWVADKIAEIEQRKREQQQWDRTPKPEGPRPASYPLSWTNKPDWLVQWEQEKKP